MRVKLSFLLFVFVWLYFELFWTQIELDRLLDRCQVESESYHFRVHRHLYTLHHSFSLTKGTTILQCCSTDIYSTNMLHMFYVYMHEQKTKIFPEVLALRALSLTRIICHRKVIRECWLNREKLNTNNMSHENVNMHNMLVESWKVEHA